MKFTYEEITSESGNINIIRTDEDGNKAWIPADEGNSDYQRYLRHLAGEDESGTLS